MKGHKFTREDLRPELQQRLADKRAKAEPVDAFLAQQTERFKIVAMDGDTPIIAEELTERLIRKHAKGDAAVLVQLRNLMQLTPEQRDRVLDAFDSTSELINTFDAPGKPAKKGKK